MSLQYMVESLEGLDESLHNLYEQTDSGYRLAVDLGDSFVPADKVAGLKANHDKLLAEKKTAAERAKEAQEAARIAAEEKALKDKDIESLTKSFKERENEWKQKYETVIQAQNAEKLNSRAMAIAAKLADGPNAELLSEFVKRRLKVVENELKIVDNDGNLTVSNEDDLIKEFQGNSMYKSLLRGTNASGGGAAGSQKGVGFKKTITRQEFDLMPHFERSNFFQNGGKLLDD